MMPRSSFVGRYAHTADRSRHGRVARWHENRLWVSDWGAQEIIATELDGRREVIARTPFGLPFCIDWLPDGRGSKWALVTGASSGFGLEFATLLAAQKANLVLVAVLTDLLELLAERLRSLYGIRVVIEAMDLSTAGCGDRPQGSDRRPWHRGRRTREQRWLRRLWRFR